MCGRTEATRRVRLAAGNLSAACLARFPSATEGILKRAFPAADDMPAEWRALLDQIRQP